MELILTVSPNLLSIWQNTAIYAVLRYADGFGGLEWFRRFQVKFGLKRTCPEQGEFLYGSGLFAQGLGFYRGCLNIGDAEAETKGSRGPKLSEGRCRIDNWCLMYIYVTEEVALWYPSSKSLCSCRVRSC
jgi:hypothetical protein